MSARPLVSLGLITCLLASCAPGRMSAPLAARMPASMAPSGVILPEHTASTTSPGATASPVTSPAASPRASLGPSASPSLRPLPGPTVVQTTLSGLVTAPARLLTENGAGFHLLADVNQVPVSNATVKLVDANGVALASPDGKPLSATTDATGHYRFDAALPSSNLVVTVALPGKAGSLEGIAEQGTGPRAGDVDVVSTLTTAYILDQYVKTQTDPVKTLDKLPPDVEAATRQVAASALATGSTALPDAFTPATVVPIVTALRDANKALDGQLEVVKKLLVAAGESDLGNGLLATQVDLGASNIAIGPDGLVYICSGVRVWKLTADGHLQAVAGSGGGTMADSVEGVKALDASISSASIAFDLQGRLLLLEYKVDMLNAIQAKDTRYRVSRLESDGTLHELFPLGLPPDGIDFEQILGASGDDVLAISGTDTVWRLSAGKAPAKLGSIGQFYLGTYGLGDDHTLQFMESNPNTLLAGRFGTFDLATGQVSVLGDLAQKVVACVDARGNGVMVEGDNTLELVNPDGSKRTLQEHFKFPDHLTLPFTLAPDGSVYLLGNSGSTLYHIANGTTQIVAGQQSVANGTDANLTGFKYPVAATFDADGNLLVLDANANQIFKVANGKTSVFAGNGTTGNQDGAGDGRPALDAPLYFPRLALVHDGNGTLYYESDHIHTIDSKGVLGSRQADAAGLGALWSLAVAPDGTLYLGGWGYGPDGKVVNEVWRSPAGSTTADVIAGPFPYDQYKNMRVALDAKGKLYISGDGNLRAWTEAGGTQLVKTDDRFVMTSDFERGLMMVLDAKARVVFCNGNRVLRYDPAADSFTVLAGPDGTHFTGSGVDDSLSNPTSPVFAPDGDLYIVDSGHHQVKRIPAAEL